MVEGKCLCGGCKIIVDAEPLHNGVAICHCVDCQHSSGSAYAVLVLVPKDKVRTEGSVKLYEFKNPRNGNTVNRWFCEGCGSHLLGLTEAHPERVSVKAGNIEEFTKLPVIAEVFVQHRWPSIPPIPGVKQLETV